MLYLYLLKFSTKAVCGARTRLNPGAYDSREGLPNNGLHIEGMYVAINATATPVRLARINWVIGGIFRDFQFQNKDIRSRLQSSQSCVTPSAIFVFAFPERYQRDTCDLFYVLVSDWSRDDANDREGARKSKITKAISGFLVKPGCIKSSWASVVRRLDNTIHRINRYPLDECWQNKPRYPLDSDYPVNSVICLLNNPGNLWRPLHPFSVLHA